MHRSLGDVYVQQCLLRLHLNLIVLPPSLKQLPWKLSWIITTEIIVYYLLFSSIMRLRSGKIINAALAMPASAPAKSFGCLYCSLRFPHAVTALNHECEEHSNCKQCKERFSGRAELQNHQQITGHCYCRECDAYFPTVRKHLNHARETTHTTPYHCCDCGREYTNQETLSYHCCECDELFRTKKFLRRHFSGKKHIGKIGVPMSMSSPNLPHKCNTCVETFHNKKQLERHMTNHRAPRNIPCLAGGDCQKKFAVPSALLNHLESGCCSSGITRAKMHQLVIDHDPNRYITSFNGLSSSHSSEYIPARYCFFQFHMTKQKLIIKVNLYHTWSSRHPRTHRQSSSHHSLLILMMTTVSASGSALAVNCKH